MAGSYLPGVGWATQANVNGVVLSVDEIDWVGDCDILETPAFTSLGKMEHVAGFVSGMIHFAGNVNKNFNPGSSGIRLGQQVPFVMTFVNPSQIATDDDAFVKRIRYTSSAAGKQRYECIMVMNWAFTDFAGNVVGN